MKRSYNLAQERRHYIRLDTAIPVQFKLISLDGKEFFSDWLQGFTSNIGKGGICLSANNLKSEFVKLVKEGRAKLTLEIEIPTIKNPVTATAWVIWINEAPENLNKYIIGLSYENIDPIQNNKIMRYVRVKKIFVPAVFGIILLLGLGLIINSFINMKLVEGNKALIAQLLNVKQEVRLTKQEINGLSKERFDLQRKIQILEQRIQGIQQEKQMLADKEHQKIEELNKLMAQLNNEKNILKEQLTKIQQKESVASQELALLDRKKDNLEKENFDKMYQWLKVHQNPRTGLVMSFEGDNNIADWAFVYDQSLVAQAYTMFSDFERAEKVFEFFDRKAKKQDGLFFNTYYVKDGEPAEYIVHSGPNIWLGIAIMQYTRKSKDNNYIKLAEQIAEAIIKLQAQDKDGGICGSPGAYWYSTEHNLDAYAYLNMLYKITGKSRYKETAGRVLDWLIKHTYDRPDLPVRRGKGDSTIATDTYAWSIAAIGPGKLEELGMKPDKIVEFAEQNCAVRVSYVRPEGQSIEIDGFDFAAQRNVARGGVVSCEWTAQMIAAFKIMADFYNKKGMIQKARIYADKADKYLSGLGNMIISSSSASGQGEGCLPYASLDNVNTGHGWITPKGRSTGSVAATAYTIFAYYNYNPLELKD